MTATMCHSPSCDREAIQLVAREAEPGHVIGLLLCQDHAGDLVYCLNTGRPIPRWAR